MIDEETLSSEELLRRFNVRMQSVWASSTIILKPWNGGLPRGADGNFLTLGVADIAGPEVPAGAADDPLHKADMHPQLGAHHSQWPPSAHVPFHGTDDEHRRV